MIFRHWRKAWALLGPGQTLKWAGLVAMAVLTTGLEILTAALVFGVVRLAASGATTLELPIIGQIGDFDVSASSSEAMLLLGAVIVLFLLRSAMILAQAYAEQRITNNAGARLAAKLCRHYLNLPYEFHLIHHSSLLMRDAFWTSQTYVTQFLLPATAFVANGILIVGMASFLLFTSPTGLLLAAAIVLPVVGIMLGVVQPKLRKLGTRSQMESKASLQALQDAIQGYRDILITGRADYFTRRFIESRASFARIAYLRGTMNYAPRALIETTLVVFIVILLLVEMTNGPNRDSLSVVALFAYVGLRLQPAIQSVVTALNNMKFSSVTVEDLHQILNAPIQSRSSDVDGSLAGQTFQSLRISNVSFRYQDAHSDSLHDLSIHVNRGESIGICGETGSGKSTLIALVCGFLEPHAGSVEVNGVDIRDDLCAWRNKIGLVPQSVYLLDASVAENVAFGVPRQKIDMEAVLRSLHLAQIAEFAQSLPSGLDTKIGENGVRLSGGQRQRLAIARALYQEPELLILDEGTSALDNKTESELVAAVEELRGTRTVIIVAHRLSTIRKCDRIVVLDQGVVQTVGRYDDLLANSREFQLLAGGGTGPGQ